MSDVPSVNALQAAIDAAEMGGAPPECVKYLRGLVERRHMPVARGHVQVMHSVPARDTVLAAINHWLDDPAPKLPGITIRAEIESAFNPPELLLIMHGRTRDGRAWEHRAIIPEYRLAAGPDALPRVVVETLETLHQSAIRTLREAAG